MYAHNAQSSKDLAWALKSFSCVLLKWLLVSWSSGKISDNSLSQNLEAKYIVFFLCHIPTFFCQREVCFHCRNRCEICIGTFALGGVGQALKQTWWTSRVGPYDFRDAENMDGLVESSHKNFIFYLMWNVTEFGWKNIVVLYNQTLLYGLLSPW